jgi:hypothetical protein
VDDTHRFASIALIGSRAWILTQERDADPVLDPECPDRLRQAGSRCPDPLGSDPRTRIT